MEAGGPRVRRQQGRGGRARDPRLLHPASAFVGPLFYHTNQSLTQPLNANLPPGAPSPVGGHAGPLGTDEHGFDELGRIMVGGQAALEVGFFAALIATVIGTLYGAIAGLAGRVRRRRS